MAPHSEPAPGFASYPSLRNRVVVITGGASGIGAALVEAFAHQGARVVFLDRDRPSAEALLAHLAATSPSLPAPIFLPCDLTDIPSLQHACASLLATHGTVDVLVNNAGDDTRHTFDSITPEAWDRILAINLKQGFFTTQALVPSMRAAGRGSVINLSSIAWLIPSIGLPVYVAAKAAIVGLTRTLAHELGPYGIRVNAILPGAIATPRQHQLWLTPEYTAEILGRQALKRLLQPEEVARLALFLAADDSAGITNGSYILDGGFV